MCGSANQGEGSEGKWVGVREKKKTKREVSEGNSDVRKREIDSQVAFLRVAESENWSR